MGSLEHPQTEKTVEDIMNMRIEQLDAQLKKLQSQAQLNTSLQKWEAEYDQRESEIVDQTNANLDEMLKKINECRCEQTVHNEMMKAFKIKERAIIADVPKVVAADERIKHINAAIEKLEREKRDRKQLQAERHQADATWLTVLRALNESVSHYGYLKQL